MCSIETRARVHIHTCWWTRTYTWIINHISQGHFPSGIHSTWRLLKIASKLSRKFLGKPDTFSGLQIALVDVDRGRFETESNPRGWKTDRINANIFLSVRNRDRVRNVGKSITEHQICVGAAGGDEGAAYVIGLVESHVGEMFNWGIAKALKVECARCLEHPGENMGKVENQRKLPFFSSLEGTWSKKHNPKWGVKTEWKIAFMRETINVKQVLCLMK